MINRLSLKYRIALVIFALEAGVMGIALWQTLGMTLRESAEQETATHRMLTDVMNEMAKTALLTMEYADLQLYLNKVRNQPSVQRIFVADVDQRVVASSDLASIGEVVTDLVDSNDRYWRQHPLVTAAGQLGTLAVEFSNDTVQGIYTRALNFGITITLVGMLAIALVGLTIGFALTRRLDRISQAVTRFAQGDVHAQSNVTGTDELGQLGANIDEMVTSVATKQRQLAESEEKHRLLFETMGQGVVYQDVNGRIFSANPAAEQLLGLTLAQMQGKSSIDPQWRTIHDDGADFPGETHPAMVALRTATPVKNVVMGVYNPKDAGHRWIIVDSQPQFRPGDDTPFQVFTTFTDITAYKDAEQALREREAQLRAIMDHSPALISIKDLEGRITMANRRFEILAGSPSNEYVGKNIFELFPKDTAEALWENDKKALVTGSAVVVEESLGHKDGTRHTYLTVKFPLVTEKEQQPFGVCSISTDITERKRQERKIWQQANFDGLTQLPNRSLFMDRLHQVSGTAQRGGKTFALMYVDLDRFKWVNDTLGHEAGDQLLRQVAKRLLIAVRETDTVARLSGDEFTILLTNIDSSQDAARIAKVLLRSLSRPYNLDVKQISYVTGSIGIALFPHDADSVSALMKCADRAMYAAKQNGRGQYCYYDSQMDVDLHSRMVLAEDLRQASTKEEWVLNYQPIIDLADQRVVGCEALVRWQHPERGVLMPDEFIGLAEESGVIRDIGKWVMRMVCNDLQDWEHAGQVELNVAVNVSPQQLRAETEAISLLDIISDAAVDHQRLHFEITENSVIENSDHATSLLGRISDTGIRLSVDDFGTGYSSLSYLRRFPIATLKIDRSFVQRATSVPADAKLICAIVSMAHSLGIKTVAEGVETLEQHQFLIKIGCDYSQGYLYSQPLPSDEFQFFVDANRHNDLVSWA